jgi:hypothetical protein
VYDNKSDALAVAHAVAALRIHRRATIMSTITVFKANDGRWQYAPETLRNWPLLRDAGRFDSKDAALEAAEEEHPHETVKVEAGLFARLF